MKPPSRGIIAATAAVAMLSAVGLVHPIGAASSQQPPTMDHTLPGHGAHAGDPRAERLECHDRCAADGVLLTVTSSDPKEIGHIRGLGFIGLLVSGSHHQPHHLAMAKGEFSHAH